MRVARVLLILFTMTVAGAVLCTLMSCESEVSAAEPEIVQMDEILIEGWIEEVIDVDQVEPAADINEEAESAPQRRVRRWQWESPAETRARIWNVPEIETKEMAATGLLRICLSEADGSEVDCLGIWQVLNTIRSRSCNRGYIRRITECDEGGETLLSVMRRSQQYAMGVIPARSRRSQWIAQVTLDCAPPPSWPHGEEQWERQYRQGCERTSELARSLVAGDHHRLPIRGVTPITWGGRCEVENGACDDPLACRRGLARIPLETHNAFWCIIGTTGCRQTPDPICVALGLADQLQDS